MVRSCPLRNGQRTRLPDGSYGGLMCRAEWGGGQGQVIHHKFVVADFNGENRRLSPGPPILPPAQAAQRQLGRRLLLPGKPRFRERTILAHPAS